MPGSDLVAAAYRHDWHVVAELHAAADALTVHEAAVVGDTEALRALLAEDPCRVEAVAPDGFRPLHLAAYYAQVDAVGLLLSHGADPDAVADKPSRLRPLHAAVAARDLETVTRLLVAGANPNARQTGGHTPLMAAALHGECATVRILVEHGADLDLRDDEGITARDRATGGTVAQLASV